MKKSPDDEMFNAVLEQEITDSGFLMSILRLFLCGGRSPQEVLFPQKT